jgi:hypothetical protein
MTVMARPAKRNGALLNSGTLSPNPWDLSLSGQNVWPYTGDTRTEDKAPQGCDLSADLSAGMLMGGCHAQGRPNSNSDPPKISLLPTKNGLDKGVHLTHHYFEPLSGSIRANASADCGRRKRTVDPTTRSLSRSRTSVANRLSKSPDKRGHRENGRGSRPVPQRTNKATGSVTPRFTK